MTFAVGSLVKARGREWVVLPDSSEDTLVLRPLGGTDDEIAGIHLPLEHVEPAQFELPDPNLLGDYRSCSLLRDAVRLGFRSSVGPFRSVSKIAVEPRSYQIVPLLMALRLNPVRLLISDDIGIGKTIEASLVARELLDRGEENRLAVLCPPQLAEQWQNEIRDKFHIEAELVLSSTATKLERQCGVGQSLFEVYPFVVVSLDFIKSDRRRDEFLRACPNLVIVDEAHTCAYGASGRGGRHQRFELIKGLSEDPNRHLILVTATPHSGKEEAFRSLLSFLNEDFTNLPEDLSGKHNEQHRRNLAKYFIQRRRADIRHYLEQDTAFPEREEKEETYTLTPEYKKFFAQVLSYARESVIDTEGNRHRQRIRWWSALALLRSLGSSPAAAAATLRSRASTIDTETPEEADELGRRTVLDLSEDDISETPDTVPGSDCDDQPDEDTQNRRKLLSLARTADTLMGEKDDKINTATPLIKKLIEDGFSPIVFCRFIPTAEYVAQELRKRLKRGIEVTAITGTLPPAEREKRILKLAESSKKILVCTDCLSEGINLQQHFDAVFHYDLSWNPTRHEQREGRVDRFGQPNPNIRVLTYYGTDNQIDGIVLDILIRKHKKIRSSLGISVPVPIDNEQVIEAIFEGLLLRETTGHATDQLVLFEDFFKPQKEKLHAEWDSVKDREKRSRTMFAQETIKPDEVANELNTIRSAIGTNIDVASFMKNALSAHNAIVSEKPNNLIKFNLTESPRGLREAIGNIDNFEARFEFPVSKNTLYLNRTHPIAEGTASYIMDTALDPIDESIARRAGVIRTSKVDKRTTLLLVRFRYHIITKRGNREYPLLAEDCQLLAFTGSPTNAEWLDSQNLEDLLTAKPEANINPDQASDFVNKVIEGYDSINSHIEEVARSRGEEILDAHQRVRQAAQMSGISYRVDPKLPPDMMGIYIYLPKI